MEDEFELLLQKYFAQTISGEERRKLYRLLASGRYDDKVGDELILTLRNELGTPVSDAERARLERLYAARIAGGIQSENARPRARSGWRWLAAAGIGAILVGMLWQVRPVSESRSAAGETGAVSDRFAAGQVPVARFTDKQLVKLPDGSTVLLNDGGELTYDPAAFGLTSRQVSLKGEAYFDIIADRARPFQVQSGGVQTTVLGTAFNVKFVPGRQEVKVTVTRGKVRVGDGRKTFGLLTPDQELTVNTATHDFIRKEVRAEASLLWKKRFLILDNIPMTEAAALIGEKFGARLRFENEKLGLCYISASFFNDEDLEHVLQVLSTVNSFTYHRQADGEILLAGGACQ